MEDNGYVFFADDSYHLPRKAALAAKKRHAAAKAKAELEYEEKLERGEIVEKSPGYYDRDPETGDYSAEFKRDRDNIINMALFGVPMHKDPIPIDEDTPLEDFVYTEGDQKKDAQILKVTKINEKAANEVVDLDSKVADEKVADEKVADEKVEEEVKEDDKIEDEEVKKDL